MFDIGLQELLLIMVVGLLVLGPERLPQAIRSVSLWVGRARRAFNHLRQEFEREVGTDDIKRQLHNESVMQTLKDTEQEIRSIGGDLKKDIDDLPFDVSDSIKPDHRKTSDDS